MTPVFVRDFRLPKSLGVNPCSMTNSDDKTDGHSLHCIIAQDRLGQPSGANFAGTRQHEVWVRSCPDVTLHTIPRCTICRDVSS